MTDAILVFETYPAFYYFAVLLLGLTVGSFLNVVIYRLPVMMEREFNCACRDHFGPFKSDKASSQKDEVFNLAVPHSTCPKCGHAIRAWENIPVVSWLLLKGKCSQCGSHIAKRYPMIELLSGLLSVLLAVHFGVTTQALFALLLLWSLIAMTFIDLDKMLLPDQLTLPVLWLGLLISLENQFVSPTEAIWGAVLGYLSLWSVYWVFKLLTGKEGMGHGDFKLLAALGAWVGYAHLPVIIILSSFVGAIFGLAMMLFNKSQQGQAIPFGPYLAVAGLITLLFGEYIVNAYWQFILT